MKKFVLLPLLFVVFTAASAEEPKQVPVPDKEVQAKVETDIKKVFKDEYAKTKTADLLALSETLVKQAKETKDAATVYVLLREAAMLAAKAGDSAQALLIADEIAARYPVNASSLKLQFLDVVNGVIVTTSANRVLSEAALKAVDDAERIDDFETATKLLKMASATAEKAKHVPLVTAVATRKKEVDAAQDAYQKAETAIKVLEKKADDPDASTVVGKYLCFHKGEWEKGLPLLAAGKDEKLRTLAKKDLSASDKTDMVEAADGWLALADGEAWKLSLQRRAYMLYESALPDLTGFAKTKVEQRMTELEKNAGIQSKFVTLDIAKVANAWTIRPIWNAGAANEVFNFEKYGKQTFGKVPYLLIDPKKKNLLALFGPLGSECKKYPESLKVPCGTSAKKIYLLGGVSGWPYPYAKEKKTVITVKLTYQDNSVEEFPLVDGDHYTGYNLDEDAPKSERVAKLKGDKQVRTLFISPRSTETIKEIEFVKGPSQAAPIIFAITVER